MSKSEEESQRIIRAAKITSNLDLLKAPSEDANLFNDDNIFVPEPGGEIKLERLVFIKLDFICIRKISVDLSTVLSQKLDMGPHQLFGWYST